jgi:alkanesulfonate monooxygenase SsuD/methylene tetrahydromethanopterin reductase-like flavin-dependent oxidoreductase (luciferase family)
VVCVKKRVSVTITIFEHKQLKEKNHILFMRGCVSKYDEDAVMTAVRFGVRVPNMVGSSFPLNKHLDFNLIMDVVKECEVSGYHSAWMNDHVNKHNLECWTTLSALAAATERIRLGTQVLCNTYRNPSLLAKMSATLDYISGGRLELGIGAGSNWDEGEHMAYGIPFPTPIERIRRMEEAIEIIKKLWMEEKASFIGRYYTIQDAICNPKPLQTPHPPIMIGGARPRLLKAVAKYADRCNLGHRTSSIELYRQTLEILRRQCDQIERDCEKLEKVYYGDLVVRNTPGELMDAMKRWYYAQQSPLPFTEWLENKQLNAVVGTPQNCLHRIQEYLDLGVSFFIFAFKDLPSRDSIRIFAREVMSSI